MIDACLSQRNIVFKIDQMVLIQKVIHLFIHTFYDVVAHIIREIFRCLLAVEFDILIEVPGQDCVDVGIMIDCYQLGVVWNSCLNDREYFDRFSKTEVNVLENLFLDDLEIKIHHIGLALLSFFLVFVQSTVLYVFSTVDYYQVIVENLGIDNIRFPTLDDS